MQNLEQIRASAALRPAEKLDRKAIAKLPALVLGNGLLAAAAFCGAEGGGDNRGQLKQAMECIARHLSEREIIPGANDIPSMIRTLSNADSVVLQRATAEALAYFALLKRFAEKKV